MDPQELVDGVEETCVAWENPRRLGVVEIPQGLVVHDGDKGVKDNNPRLAIVQTEVHGLPCVTIVDVVEHTAVTIPSAIAVALARWIEVGEV